MEIEMELQQRIEEEGFEILLILPVMEAVSIGLQRFNWDLSRRSCTISFLIIWKAISLT